MKPNLKLLKARALAEAKKPFQRRLKEIETEDGLSKAIRSSTNRGFVSEVVSGCGYCKTSTATAYALNQEPYLLLLMALKIEEYLKKCPKTTDNDNTIHREVLGYGTGYNTLPSFEGGVGVGCHQRIVETLGLKWSNVSSTDWVDVFQVSYD